MNEILQLQKIDYLTWITTGFLILAAIVAATTIIGKFSEIIGKPVKWVKKKNEERTLLLKTTQSLDELWAQRSTDVEQSIRHDKILQEDLHNISDKLDSLSEQISLMQCKIDETEMAKLKDAIIAYYKKYKDLGAWSELEKDAFWDLFKSYEAHGGDGYIHSVVEPVMLELNVTD